MRYFSNLIWAIRFSSDSLKRSLGNFLCFVFNLEVNIEGSAKGGSNCVHVTYHMINVCPLEKMVGG
jgi:hypothetical protein